MKHLSISFVFLMITFGVIAASADNHPESGGLLEEISYEAVTDSSEALFFKLNSVLKPKIFKIKGEKPRLVIDFFDTAYSPSVKKIDETGGQLIKSVRIGAHKDPPKTRVVVDLKTDREYDFEVKPEEGENNLVVTLSFSEDRSEPADQPEGSDATADEQKPMAPPLQVKESVQQEIDSPSVREKVADPGVIVPETTVLPEKEAALTAVEEKEVDGFDQVESSPEQEKQSASLPAEERVNKIIANINDPKPAAADPILLDVSYESTANDSEMVLFKLNDFYPPIVFGIEKGNPRVVCDFLDTMLAVDIPPVIETDGFFVRKIRTARHPSPEKVRVVLDLVPNKNYDLQQVFFKEDNLFVIIISEFEKESVKPLKTVPETVKSQ